MFAFIYSAADKAGSLLVVAILALPFVLLPALQFFSRKLAVIVCAIAAVFVAAVSWRAIGEAYTSSCPPYFLYLFPFFAGLISIVYAIALYKRGRPEVIVSILFARFGLLICSQGKKETLAEICRALTSAESSAEPSGD